MKLSKLLLLSLCVFIISCGDDPLEEVIVGNWQVEAVRIENCAISQQNLPWTNTTPGSCLSNDSIEFSGCVVSVRFNMDGTSEISFILNGDSQVERGFYSVIGEEVFICLNENDDLSNCETARIEDDQLIYSVSALRGSDCPEQYRMSKS